MVFPERMINRAQGCLVGQIVGDALGSQVEFQPPAEIRARFPNGVRELRGSPIWRTLPGQPTDDSEMALALARTLVRLSRYNKTAAFQAYQAWLTSGPFDCGGTILRALTGQPNPESQANGALMRVSPLGIFGARVDLHLVAQWAREDASLTHPHPVCQDTNALFAMALSHAIRTGCGPESLYKEIVRWAEELRVDPRVRETVQRSAEEPPADYLTHQGWVLVAFGNALWQLLHTRDFEEALVDTVMRGGDTDTNAAITGALLGAVYGLSAIPERWVRTVLSCRPEEGRPGVERPRPREYWPVDALELAASLLASAPIPGSCYHKEPTKEAH